MKPYVFRASRRALLLPTAAGVAYAAVAIFSLAQSGRTLDVLGLLTSVIAMGFLVCLFRGSLTIDDDRLIIRVIRNRAIPIGGVREVARGRSRLVIIMKDGECVPVPVALTRSERDARMKELADRLNDRVRSPQMSAGPVPAPRA